MSGVYALPYSSIIEIQSGKILGRTASGVGVAQELSGADVASILALGSAAYADVEDITPSWGDITGTLSNQTDLNTALNARLSLTGGTLTGALSGTSISLSGSLTVAASQGITSANFTRISGSDQPTRGIAVRDGQLNFASNVSMYWSTSLDPTASAAGISLVTDGTSHFWQRSGATAQAYYLSNNYTDAGNYERGFLRWNSNVLEIGTEATGTGTGTREVRVRIGGVDRLQIGTSTLNIRHTVVPLVNVLDIGTAVSPWKNAYLSGTLNIASGAVTSSTPLLNITQEWNNGSTTFTALKVNVTDTASAGASLLADFQVGGGSRLSINKSGTIRLAAGAALEYNGGTASLLFNGGNIYSTGVSYLGDSVAAGVGTSTNGGAVGGLLMSSSRAVQWSSDGTWYGTKDLFLLRDAANVLAQRNGINSQALRLYNTYTDPNNYENLQFSWVSNEARIGTAPLGTGTQRSILLGHWDIAGTWQQRLSVVPGGNLITYTPNFEFRVLAGGQVGTINTANNLLTIAASSNAHPLVLRGNNHGVRLGDGTYTFDIKPVGSNSVVGFYTGQGTTPASGSLASLLAASFAANGTNSPRTYALGDSTNSRGLEFFTGAGRLYYREGSNAVCSFGVSTGFLLSASHPLGWCPTSPDGVADITLHRDAPYTLALRLGTNPNALRVYNTYTDASNYERGFLRWNSNVLEIGTEAAGTGTARAMRLLASGVRVGNVSGSRLYFENASGSPSITNYSNAGISVLKHDGNRGTLDCSDVIVDSGQYFYWRTRALMTSSANGIVHIQEYQADDSVGQTLCLGLATSATNGLRFKRATGSDLVTIRNGNDTADASLRADTLAASAYFAGYERSSDPSDPSEGSFALWMSDGTGAGDDGDIMMKITAGGVTTTTRLTGVTGRFDSTEYEFTGTYVYYGGEYENGDWEIRRVTVPGGVRTAASESNNVGYTDLATAWTDRASLTYA